MKASPRSSASPQESAKASTKASTQASTKASAQASTKASTQAAVKASAQESTKESAKASASASPQDASAQQPLKFSGSQLEPVKWNELAGWAADDHLAAFAAYQASCRAAHKLRRADHAEISGALWNVCRNALDLRPQDSDTARAFFERNFQPVRIARLGEVDGLLTGYFEPVVAGSRFPSPEFHVPVYRRPRDLVVAGYNSASVAFPNKGARIGRRTANNELVPYHDRGAIEAGALDGQKLEICWLKDPFDLLTMQIEGSARMILEDGMPLRISYDSHNGYRMSSIERVLVERNLIPRQEMSAQRIRDWMAAHPDEAAKVRAANRSYVFFRITGLSNEGEPVGAQGVPLTPGRSIAVDRVHEYGTPFFIEANLPIESGKSASPFGRLMIAQDTGSALVGPARADLYWGAGDGAGRIAGRIRHPGRFAMLVPRELDLVAAGKRMPLPVPKPKIAEVEIDKTDGKGKASSANAGAIAAGKEIPKRPASPAPKPKMAASDVKQEVKTKDDKGRATSIGAGATAAGKQPPKHPASPAPKPKMAASDVKQEIKTEGGKGRATSANTGATVAGKQPPKHPASPAPKPKAPAIEVKKKDGKRKANSTNTANSGEDWRATVGSGRPSAPARVAN